MDLTQREVADRVGASTPYIGHLESGKRHPSEEVVARLADVLGFHCKELFFLANPEAHPNRCFAGGDFRQFGVGRVQPQ